MKFDPEFKNAILQLPSKEKDKLLLRLLKRDVILANQLHFELISGDSVQDRRSRMEAHIKQKIEWATNRFSSLDSLLVDIRSLSADITENVKITKDKYGDVSLNLLMLNELLKNNNARIAKSNFKKTSAISIYIIARIFKILVSIKALHEDYLIEFEAGLNELAQAIEKNPILLNMAINTGVDINWLADAEIPDNIAEIHKEIRSKGLLKRNVKMF